MSLLWGCDHWSIINNPAVKESYRLFPSFLPVTDRNTAARAFLHSRLFMPILFLPPCITYPWRRGMRMRWRLSRPRFNLTAFRGRYCQQQPLGRKSRRLLLKMHPFARDPFFTGDCKNKGKKGGGHFSHIVWRPRHLPARPSPPSLWSSAPPRSF